MASDTETSVGPHTPAGRELIRSARGRFVAMAASYSLGSLNDNFFKQAALLLSLAILEQGSRLPTGQAWLLERIQSFATILYTLPFLLFAAYAGWLADRFSKRRIVIAAKLMELLAMIVGGVGMLTGNWVLMLAMIFLMGAQASIFSPAINGSIPELYPDWHVTKANAKMKVFTTAAILVGVALGGFVLGLGGKAGLHLHPGRVAVAVGAVVMAAVGLAVSFGVPRRPAADPAAPFPRMGPVNTLIELVRTLRDRLLALVIAVDAYIWFLGLLLSLLINKMGMQQMHVGESVTSVMVVAELVGIAVGGLIAGRVCTGPRWYRFSAAAIIGMGLVLMSVALLPWVPQQWMLCVAIAQLAAAGVCGGIVLIPMESFIQIRPDPRRKGTVIAAANFAAFGAMLLSGPCSDGVVSWLLYAGGVWAGTFATSAIALAGVVTLAVGLALMPVLWRWREP